MVYKKFIKRGGKVFGPYYYESYRDKNGKIKTRYLENYKETFSKKRLIISILFLAFISILFLAYFNQNSNISGNSILSSISDFFSKVRIPSIESQPVYNQPLDFEENIILNENLNVRTIQYKAVINRPVRWIRIINTKDLKNNLEFELPKQAEGIVIKTGNEVQEALNEFKEYELTINNTNRKYFLATGKVSLEINSKKGILTRFFDWINDFNFTGKIIQGQQIQEKITEFENRKVLDLKKISSSYPNQEIAIEYYTPSPVLTETNISEGKKMIVFTLDEFGYKDILAYTSFNNKVKIKDNNKIRFYWYRNVSGNIFKQEINFTYYDLDEDSNIDYVEWNVDSLSQQVYEVVYNIDGLAFPGPINYINNCTKIYSSGNYYLNNSIKFSSGVCIMFYSYNVLFDCNNFEISGGSEINSLSSIAIALGSSSIVRNCIINMTNNTQNYGVSLNGAKNSIVRNIKVNAGYGISLNGYATNNTISDINVRDSRYGISLNGFSSNNTLSNINAENNNMGISINGWCNDNLVFNSHLKDNNYGVSLNGFSSNNTLLNINAENNNYGILINGWCDSNTLINSLIDLSNTGISVSSSSKNYFVNNTVLNCNKQVSSNCISLSSSQNNTFEGNTLRNSTGCLIYLSSSSGNQFNNINLFEAGRSEPCFYNSYNNSFFNLNEIKVISEPSGTEVNSCRQLDVPNSVYTQIGDIVANSSPCIKIVADNVIFDCSGKSISNSSFEGIGILATGVRNVTIKNCNLGFSYNSPTSEAIRFHEVKDSVIKNVSINLTYIGVYLSSSENNVIEDIDTYRCYWHSVYLSNSNNNSLLNLFLRETSYKAIYLLHSSDNFISRVNAESNTYSISLDSNSNNNLIFDNFLNHSISEGVSLSSNSNNNNIINNTFFAEQMAGYGISIRLSQNNIISGNKMKNYQTALSFIDSNDNVAFDNYFEQCIFRKIGCLYFFNSNKNIIYNSIINFSLNNSVYFKQSSNNNRFINLSLFLAGNKHIYSESGINNTFVNVNFDEQKEFVDLNSQTYRKWYYRALVRDTSGKAIENANVILYDVFGAKEFNLTTNSLGYTPIVEVLDYSLSNNIRKSYSNYMVYAMKSDYLTINHSYNATSQKNLFEDSFVLNLGQKMPAFTKIPSNLTLIYGDSFGVDFDSDGDVTFLINDTSRFNINSSGFLKNTKVLPAGIHFLNVSIRNSFGYVSSVIYKIIIEKASGIVYAYVNSSRSNFVSLEGSEISVGAGIIQGKGRIILYLNNEVINSGENSLSNLTNLLVGKYNLTAVYNGNNNYTSDSDVLNINILESNESLPQDNINIQLVSPEDGITTTLSSVEFKFNISSLNELLDCGVFLNKEYYNSTSLSNNYSLIISDISSGVYDWFAFCTDILDNQKNSSIRTFIVYTENGEGDGGGNNGGGGEGASGGGGGGEGEVQVNNNSEIRQEELSEEDIKEIEEQKENPLKTSLDPITYSALIKSSAIFTVTNIIVFSFFLSLAYFIKKKFYKKNKNKNKNKNKKL